MGIMASYNLLYKKKNPKFYDNVEIIRLNSPWYTKEDLIDVLIKVDKPKFIDVNIKFRTKSKVADHNYSELLKIAGEHRVEWVGISNIEDTTKYGYVRKLLGNDVTKICAKIETLEGCKRVSDIIDVFDGVMVDVEDLAFEVGWEKAAIEKDKIYGLCENLGKEHFKMTGAIFEHIKVANVVYTYGAFDLLHPGHINMLKTAKSYGDKLIVGVVSDDAIKKLKGKNRPIQKQEDRIKIVSSLKCVDRVMPQNSYDPVPNMENIGPDVLVKGDDWDYIPGQEWIQKNNGKLIKPKYSEGWSTSNIIKQVVGA